MNRQNKNNQENPDDLIIVPIDEEKERSEAIMNWIVEVLDYAGRLPGPFSKISASRRWPDKTTAYVETEE